MVNVERREQELPKEKKKYGRSRERQATKQKQLKTFTRTQQTEWNRKWFLFDFRACIWNSHDCFFLFLSVWCVDYRADECVCYLCMIFLYHWMFPKRMVCVRKSQNRKNTLDEKKKTPCSDKYVARTKNAWNALTLFGFFWVIFMFFFYENGIQVWKKFIQPITQDAST